MLLETIDQLNTTQRQFVSWNARRLNVSEKASFERLTLSWNAIEGGYGDSRFREFNVACHDVFQVFYGDDKNEVMASYEFFAPLHLLRMLSYPEPLIKPQNPMVQALQKRSHVTVLDFGCGLAQVSRALSIYLMQQGKKVELFLADIPTIRKDFLLYLCSNSDIDTTFLDCTLEQPVPQLPVHNICIATEFFEHVYRPVEYFEAIDSVLQPEGLLVTNVANHNREFMHVSPNLAILRDAIARRGYKTIKSDKVFLKGLKDN
ncbi:MAG: hypothetical protein ACR2QW_17050 [bacterium]